MEIVPPVSRPERITIGKIRGLAARIVRRFRPERVILFGSYAYGTPTPDSDIDLLVILKRRSDAAAIRCALPDSLPTDVLALTPARVARRLKAGDSFLTEILQRGRILYDTRRSRVG